MDVIVLLKVILFTAFAVPFIRCCYLKFISKAVASISDKLKEKGKQATKGAKNAERRLSAMIYKTGEGNQSTS
eukprot:7544795-Ditylum_brightwellii.AAC.1